MNRSVLPPTETLPVRRGRVSSVDVFEVKEGELDKIEEGLETPTDLLNAGFFSSSSFTSIASLVTSDFEWEIAKFVFVSVAIFGAIFSVIFYMKWRKKKAVRAEVISEIRNRIENGGLTVSENNGSDTNPGPSPPP